MASRPKNPVCHFEMPYEDAARVSKFYADAFGWQLQQLGPEMNNYITAGTTDTDEQRMVTRPGTINGGFFMTIPGIGEYVSLLDTEGNRVSILQATR